jgi:hypothetical protein
VKGNRRDIEGIKRSHNYPAQRVTYKRNWSRDILQFQEKREPFGGVPYMNTA